MVSETARIDTIEDFGIDAGVTYKLEIFKDGMAEHDSMEQVEMGERYGIEFSLKIDFSEFDDQKLAENLQKNVRDFLPLNMEQIAKEKKSILGLNEKSFTMGNRDMIHLIEFGDGWKDHVFVPSYVPKEQRIFSIAHSDQVVVASLPFEVNDVAEMVYAGIYEYTQGVNLLSLHIIDDETHEEVAMSSQGKHFSLISGAFLPEGNYYLVIKNDRLNGMGTTTAAPLRFVLDAVRHQIPEHHDFMARQLEHLQLCSLPTLHFTSLTSPGFVHALSGYAT